MNKKEQEIKSIQAITEKRAGKLTAIASTEDRDRQGDSLSAKQWDFTKFKMNPVLQAGHNYAPQFNIGVAKNIRVEGKEVLFEPVFHEITPLAKQIKEMFDKGFLKAWSVGFIPAQNEKDFHELLEVSAVAVPANAFALMKGFDDKGEELDLEIKEWIQKTEEDSELGEIIDELIDEETPEETPEEETPVVEETPAVEEKNITPWNKSLPSVFAKKEFDITQVKADHMSFENEVFTKFFGCKVKDLFVNDYAIPSPLLGSYLAGFKEVLSDYELVDTRNWYGTAEFPPTYEVIQLNSEKSDDFLVEGTTFYKVAGKNGVAIKFMPGWNGMYISVVSDGEKKEWNKKLLKKVQKWVQDNNFLKGEKFALSGEFIDKGQREWDLLFADEKNISSVQKSLKVLEGKAKSRGLLFVGPPGTGKTLTGKVLMDNTESTFIWVSSKDMYRVGAVGALKLAFSLARDLGPSILFMEDIDTWIQREAVDMLKTELDGMQENKGLLTILTSNFPENLPDALLDRPGRFHEILNYDLPTKEVRSEMIHQWSGVEKEIADIYAEQTKGMSGAHIKELIEYAEMLKEDDDIGMSEALGKSLDKLIEQKELIGKIRQNTKGFDIISMKEGKVISKKNLEKIVSARDALNGVIDISDKVNDSKISEETEKFLNNMEVIGKEIENQGVKGDELVIKTLQAIVKVSNKTLHESKKARN